MIQQKKQLRQQKELFSFRQNEMRSVRILVVSVDVSISQGLEQALPSFIECMASNSGLVALDLIEMWNPDVVVIDTKISDILYDALCLQMRCSKHMDRVPIIVMSQRKGLFEKYRCIEAGASDYINMPVSSAVLAQRVMLTLNLRTSQQTARQNNIFATS